VASRKSRGETVSTAPSPGGRIGPTGTLSLVKFNAWPQALTIGAVLKHGLPRPGLGWEVNSWRIRNLPNLMRGARKVVVAQALGIPTLYGALYLDKFTPHGRVAYGLASLRVVTTTGAGFIVDAFENIVELELMKFHGFGSGTNAEAVGDTGLQTEYTTEYATDNTRPTGTQTENGSTVYETVASFDPDSAVTVAEHGIFSQAATGGGVLLDRSKFTGVPVAASGETLQATYDFTVNTGG
jgi:hypothetical protein